MNKANNNDTCYEKKLLLIMTGDEKLLDISHKKLISPMMRS